jgi:pimeloyl-ACP methyl ester carboxylesterase
VKIVRGVLKALGVLVALIAIAVGIWALLPAKTTPIAGEHAIAALERIALGGVPQTILLRGHDVRSPLLLHVHGGPGAGQLPLAPFYSGELERHFVVVHWDQRGAGASCEGVDPATLSLERIVDDAIELASALKARFGQPIVLLGHSWGSLVGVRVVQRRPDLFSAYVGVGQLVSLKRNEEISYRWVLDEAKRRGERDALAELEAIGPPPYANSEELGVQRSYLMRWGGSIHDFRRARAALPAFLLGREYSLATRLRFFGCFNRSIDRLWGSIQEIDLMTEAPSLELPVVLLIGRADYNTPWELTEEWARRLSAPKLEVVWFDGVGHFLPIENRDAFQRTLIDRVLPLARVASMEK